MFIAKLRSHASALAIATMAVSIASVPGAATAQAVDPTQRHFHFDIAAGPLLQAFSRYSEITGIQLIYPSSVAQGLSSPGVAGDYTAREALTRLAAGTGLVPMMVSATSATLEAPVSVEGAHTLGSVDVEGEQSSGFAAVNGFGAGAGSNGSSDPTATEGTGSFTTNGASVASKTAQSLKDTTQSVSVLTQERIQQQNLTDLTTAVSNLTGVTVVQTSGVQSGYVARGFNINTYQVDGGAPQTLSFGAQTADQNLGEFDNVQIIRGSDALFGGAGQPGGVVSLDRKRPLDHNQVILDLNLGSWNNYRGQADITGPLAFDGALKGRLVVEDQDRDFFYKVAHTNTAFIYGTLEGDIGSNTVVRVGGSYERQNNHGYDATGLPRYTDGGDLNLPRSTCLCATWGYWDFRTSEVFGAVEHKINDDWRLKLNLTRTDRKSNNVVPYTQGNINRGAATGTGETLAAVINNPGIDDTKFGVDGNLTGSFSLFGQKQNILIGMDYSRERSFFGQGYLSTNVEIPDIYNFHPSVLDPEPAIPSVTTTSDQLVEQYGGYATLNLQLTKALHVTGGVRVSTYNYNQIIDYGGGFVVPTKFHSRWVPTPFASVKYDVLKSVSLYASYADIYQSQAGDLDPEGKPIQPVSGVTYEGGIKGAFRGGKLNASLSYYYTKEQNQAVFDLAAIGQCAIGFLCYINTGDYKSRGVDFELSGEVLPGWQMQLGYTYNRNKYGSAYAAQDEFGAFNVQQPKHQVKFWTSYVLPGIYHAWTLGGGVRLESARATSGSVCNVAVDPVTGACSGSDVPFNYTQPLYVVVDLRVGYQITSHWLTALNITNVGDKRYFNTAGTSASSNFYGEPRAFMFSVHATY